MLEVSIPKECAMQKLKLMLAAAAVLGAGLTATTNFAAAQDAVLTAPGCAAAPAQPWRWYKTYHSDDFVADWRPFFRHHYYRYVLACPATAAPEAVTISSKY
jgi:hypothetical protein